MGGCQSLLSQATGCRKRTMVLKKSSDTLRSKPCRCDAMRRSPAVLFVCVVFSRSVRSPCSVPNLVIPETSGSTLCPCAAIALSAGGFLCRFWRAEPGVAAKCLLSPERAGPSSFPSEEDSIVGEDQKIFLFICSTVSSLVAILLMFSVGLRQPPPPNQAVRETLEGG